MRTNRRRVVLVAGSVAGWRSLATTRGMIEVLAKRESINRGYMSRVLRFAPDIVDAILDGRQRAELQLDDLPERFPLDWAGQRHNFGGSPLL